MTKLNIKCQQCGTLFWVIYVSNGTNNRKYCDECRIKRFNTNQREYRKSHSSGKPVGRPNGVIKNKITDKEFDMKKVFQWDDINVFI